MLGKILGDRYELIEQIGEGGMSFVYKARCRKLNRYVAVKVLKDSFKGNQEIIDKFKREATAIANLSNANIVNVLDVGTQDDIHYIVMEYIEGKTLKEIITQKGRIPYEVSLSIALKVSKALECAHRNGVIHRDIKPQNILVTEEGIVKVTDFGIAKSMDSETIAHTSSILGSAHYFSPEQARGSYIDFRADIYALGIVLYEMTTGVVPFDADSPVTVAVKHIQEIPVAPKNINSTIPDALNKIILKCIEKDPINRYQTVRELITDLEKVRSNPNAIIGTKVVNEDQFTRVMSPISEAIHTSNNNTVKEEFDENDFEDNSDDYDEVAVSKKKKKKKSNLSWILGAIGVIVLGILAGMLVMKSLTGNIGNNTELSVPNVIGLSKDAAKSTIEKLGLVFVESPEISDKDQDTVIRTEPAFGSKVKEGDTVTVFISSGETKFKLTNLTNMSLSSVEDLLKTLGLKRGNVDYEYSDTIDKDNIIRQNPGYGYEVSKGDTIDLVVSKGAEVVVEKVPDFIGKSVEDAKTLAESLKFKLNAVKGEKALSKDQEGKIYKQDPGDGYEVKQGTELTVYYYDNYEEPKKTYKTNDLIGMSKSEAETWANERNIAINFTPSNSQSNWIVESVNTNEVIDGGNITAVLKEPKVTEPPSETTEGDVSTDDEEALETDTSAQEDLNE